MMKKVNIFGTGLIGTSIGLALKNSGNKNSGNKNSGNNAEWEIYGTDANPKNIKKAIQMGAVDVEGTAEDAEISFVSVPVAEQTAVIKEALEKTTGVVTDVGSVKAAIVKNTSDSRFVGGHPMAGNELDGTAGAKPDLFEGAVWVLTPTLETLDATYTKVRETIKKMGAEIINLSAPDHDHLVALISHVPHLTAGALMRRALNYSQEHRVLMRLAAGGFRDMTRIASGQPDIWLDICEENKEAILEQLSELIKELEKVRDIVEKGDREKLREELMSARQARISLPVGGAQPEDLLELRVPILDKPGSVADIANLASQLNINIYDLEIAHFSEGGQGTIILVVEAAVGGEFTKKLEAEGYRPSSKSLE